MSAIIGVTVGTPTSPQKIEKEIKPVKTVNGVEPDENGNVEVDGGGDTTELEQQIAANAGAIEALDQRVEGNEESIRDLYGKLPSGGTGTVSWNDLTDKPFGDESVTIEWDGSTDGHTLIPLSGNTKGIKVSNLTPEPEELINGEIRVLRADGVTENITITADAITDYRSMGYNMLMIGEFITIVVYEDNLNVEGLVFPEKGIYFGFNSATGAEGQYLTYGSLKKLDPKYLPDGIGGSGLPPVTEADNGKFLQVVNGAYALVAAQTYIAVATEEEATDTEAIPINDGQVIVVTGE